MKKLNAGRPLLAWATILTVLATAGSILSGCSLTPVEHNVVRVELPSFPEPGVSLHRSAKANLMTAVDGFDYGYAREQRPTPGSRTAFKCFAINVRGPGIPEDATMKCRDKSEYLGVIAGYFPIKDNEPTVMELTVPSGTDRELEVIAFTLQSGATECPKSIVGGENDPTGSPYIVGRAKFDLFGDRAVEVEATYDPVTATPAYRSCEDKLKVAIPPVAIYTGYSTTSMPLGGLTNLAIGGTSLSLDNALRGKLVYEDTRNDTKIQATPENSIVHGPCAAGGCTGRAVIEIHFDVTDYVDQLPYMSLEIGGAWELGPAGNTTCSDSGAAATQVGLVKGRENVLIRGRSFGSSCINHTRYFELPSGVVRSGYVNSVLRKLLIVQVEASNAASSAIVSSAMLFLMDRPEGLRIWPNEGTKINKDSWIGISADGGVGPYTYQIGSGTPGMGEITLYADGGVSLHTFGTSGFIDIVVTDAIGKTLVRGLEIIDAIAQDPVVAPRALSITGPTTIPEGQCSEYVVNFEQPHLAGEVALWTWDPGTSTNDWAVFTSSSDCFLGVNVQNSLNVADTDTTRHFWIRPFSGSTTREVNASFSAVAGVTAKLSVTVNPALAASYLDIVLPDAPGGTLSFNSGACVPVRLNAMTADGFGKLAAAAALSVGVTHPHGLFLDAGCGTSLSTGVALAAGSFGTTLYLRPGNAATGMLNIVGTFSTSKLFSVYDPCAGTPAIGTVCLDGTIYAGFFDGGHYRVTPGGCEADPSGSLYTSPTADFTPSCTGTDTLRKSWNDGGSISYDIPNIVNNTSASAHSTQRGDELTNILAQITNSPQGGLHAAANYCDKLSFGGVTSWYLPSKSELAYLFCKSRTSGPSPSYPEVDPNCASVGYASSESEKIPGFVIQSGESYWASSEKGGTLAWRQDFGTGSQFYVSKSAVNYVRCVMRYY